MRRRERNRCLHRRLEDWGHWVNQPVTGLEYRSQTTEAVMMEMGGIFRSGNSTTIVPMYRPNKQCAEVDKGIIAMTSTPLTRAIEARYQHCYKDKQAHDYCRCSMKQYYISLKNAEIYLAAWLGYSWED